MKKLTLNTKLICILVMIATVFCTFTGCGVKVEEFPMPEIGKMPNIVSYNYFEVNTYYAEYFDLVVESQEYSNEFPNGTIIKQTPAEGKEYIIGNTTVKVVVSKGPRLVTIPNVYGLDSETAFNILHDNGGFNVIVTDVLDEIIPNGQVIKTDPPQNEKVAYGSTIQMYVSCGSEAVVTETTVEKLSVEKDGRYTTPEDVAEYIHTFGTLPSNFITKKEAQKLGWDNKKGNLWDVTDRMSIGGDYFGNYEGLLPEADGRKYTECDVNYEGGYRGSERIIFSNDGLIFYTDDHYESFTQLY